MKNPILYKYSIPTRFSDLRVPFKIYEKQKGKIYSEGRIEFSIVDVKTGWMTPITNEINNLLFEKGE